MKRKLWILPLLVFALGCRSAAPVETPTPVVSPTPEPTPTLADPAVTTSRPADPQEAAAAYFDFWLADDFAAMYAMLTAASREALSQEAFTERYIDALAMAAVPPGELAYELLDSAVHPDAAQVRYRLTWKSVLFGDISRENTLFLELEGASWAVIWDISLILPDLVGGNQVQRIYYVPSARGDIYDRSGQLMVGLSDAYAIGIVPVEISNNEEEENAMLNLVGRATGLPAEYLANLVQGVGYDYPFYLPINDVSPEQIGGLFTGLNSYDAVSVSQFSARYYFGPGDAAHLLGYTSFVSPDEQDALTRQGYWWTSRVPRIGVELWADQYLAGTQGGALAINNANGEQVSLLAEKFPQPGGSISLTIDKDLQTAAQQALFDMRGAVVVLELDTGRILALASSPTYSPNLFEPENPNSLFTSPFNDPQQPTLNRAINGQYPLGSVFKIITMATALETGLFTVEDTYDCQYEFTELLPSGPVLYDWTYERNLERLENDQSPFPPSGLLTLPEGLMRSCNPWFYHIGLALFNAELSGSLSDMARGFGLGSPTGVIGLPGESSGQVVNPDEPLAFTNLATGQGELLVTPLQVAHFVAAVGNGGTFYTPQLVEQAVDQDGNIIYEFSAQIAGELPLSQETMAAVQDAMKLVTQDSRGTANLIFRNFGLDIAGKTGTAQSSQADPHAWFVAYSDENREDKPDIAVVAVIENRGEGSEWAAPVVRRVLENYFFNRTLRSYPWEIRIGVPEWLVPEPPEEEGGENG
jgi:penicillin-binding protein 2